MSMTHPLAELLIHQTAYQTGTLERAERTLVLKMYNSKGEPQASMTVPLLGFADCQALSAALAVFAGGEVRHPQDWPKSPSRRDLASYRRGPARRALDSTLDWCETAQG
jgi:hypothetical protein